MSKQVIRREQLRVALLVESSRAYGRGVLSGVARFIREHGDWSVSLQEHSLCDEVPDWLRSWQGHGILTRMEDRSILQVVQQLRLPTVSLRNVEPGMCLPAVLTDNAAVSQAAFAHLRERGFHHFAFCGFNGADYSDERRDSFVRQASQAHVRCHVFEGRPQRDRFSTAEYEEAGLLDGESVAHWIKSLPKPVGLMACNDMRGQQVLSACRALGVPVPDDVAVIGVDNEEVLCDLSDPPLSSVVPNAERVGYEAAALLDDMMGGRRPPRQLCLVEPVGVVTRRSTDVLAIADRKIAFAVRFIREHACEGIGVAEVVQAVALSRSTLERRFSKALGCSPKDEILRVRLRFAKQLLAETNSSLEVIAEKIGLEYSEYLSRIFKKKTGMTPSEFRSHSRVAERADRLPTPLAFQ